MRFINIEGKEFPFHTTYLALTQFCASKGFAFADIGELLAKHPFEGIYGILTLGLNGGAKKVGKKEDWTIDRIDEYVGTDSELLNELSVHVFEALGGDSSQKKMQKVTKVVQKKTA